MLPLQVIDTFLLDYNVGQALLLGYILMMLAALPLKSQKILAINTILFGVIFMVTPLGVAAPHYLFLGIALLVVGPLIYVTARS